MGKLRGTQYKGRNSAVKFSQLSWAIQYKKCEQYDFKFTSIYSELCIYFIFQNEYSQYSMTLICLISFYFLIISSCRMKK